MEDRCQESLGNGNRLRFAGRITLNPRAPTGYNAPQHAVKTLNLSNRSQ